MAVYNQLLQVASYGEDSGKMSNKNTKNHIKNITTIKYVTDYATNIS